MPTQAQPARLATAFRCQAAPLAETLLERFAAQVEATPTAIALSFAPTLHHNPLLPAPRATAEAVTEPLGTTLTYRDLDARANQLAHYLQTLGVRVGQEAVVGVALERSPELIIAFLAILKAGGVYLPLDPTYPPERLAFMMADAELALLMTHTHLQATLPLTTAQQLCLDQVAAVLAQQPTTPPATLIQPDHLAYVIYTSGSTGRPKGVLVEHGGLGCLVAAQRQLFGLQPGDRVLQLSSLNFDASIWEIGMALGSGATLCLAPATALLPGPALTRLLQEAAITHLTIVPSALATLSPAALPGLRTVIVAGEACPTPLAQRWLPGRRFFNAYGPTEATVCATIHECTPATLGVDSPPIGQPLANVQILLLDATGQLIQPSAATASAAGEVHIGGALVARGYLNQPALTAEKFIPNPVGSGRLYRSGDLARWVPSPAGGPPQLAFLGRIDQQVKLRGLRIELGEIEAQLSGDDQVQSALVLARSGADGLPQLVAYLVLAGGDATTIRQRLRQRLQRTLPAYMIPAAFVILPILPVMPNGKVDRHALPAPTDHDFDAADLADAEMAPPQTPTEAQLIPLWGELLGRQQVGRLTDFFAGGGHSLLATQLLARVQGQWGLELPLPTLFAAPTPAALGAVIDSQPPAGAIRPAPRVVAGARPARLPLAAAQERLWFLAQLEGASPTYNIVVPLRLQGPLVISALHAALQAVVDRHESLRTRFPAQDGVPYQQIVPHWRVDLPVVPLAGQGEAQLTLLQALLQTAAWQPFDLVAGPLLRTTLYQLGPTDHLLLLAFHHIIIDGWSLGIVLRELDHFYRLHTAANVAPLPALPFHYADFALWQQTYLQSAAVAAQRAYWRTQLAGAPTLLPLPTDFPRPPRPRFQGGAVPFTLPVALTAALHTLSQQQGVTPFMVLYAAFATVLARYSGQSDLVIGATVANRRQPELEGLIGFFVNTLPLRVDLSGEPTGSELLARVRQLTLAAYANQDLPFAQLVSELQVERSPSYAPLCQVMITFDNTQHRQPAIGPVTATTAPLASTVAKFDLTLSLTAEGSTIAAVLESDRDLFQPTTMARLADHFQRLVAALIADPSCPVHRLPLISPVERQQLLVEWNTTATTYPKAVPIHQLFELQVNRTPNAVAVVFADGERERRDETRATQPGTRDLRDGANHQVPNHHSLTYRQLNEQANQLAHYLRQQGVGPGTLVGLCLERSPQLIVAMLAILKAGGAYVPLDPNYPPARLTLMLEDTATPLIITQHSLRSRLPSTVATLALDTEWPLVATQPTTALGILLSSASLAYVMYTSGSTGRPKGVMVTHRNVVRLVCNTNYADLGADQVFLQLAPSAFDAATFEIWGPLLNGGRLVVMAPGQPSLAAIGATIRGYGVTTLWLTAGLFHLMVDEHLAALRPLRQLLAGGDVLSVSHVQRFLRAAPACRLINGYGPTENTTFTCCHALAPDAPLGPSVPIGRPLANTQVYVLDPWLQPVPIGVPGELYTGGDGVAVGYLNQPALTAERFIVNPFAELTGSARLYKTGDLVRWLPDGTLEFLGRIDQQVKLRGFRIDLGEIETILARHEAVQAAVVVAQPTPGVAGEKRLIAYVVLATPWSTLTGAEEAVAPLLRPYLQRQLPDYMVPVLFLPLAQLPLSPHGKVDRQALPAPAPTQWPAVMGATPCQTPTEELLAAIWSEVLGVTTVGRADDFFALGGHSLVATQVVARIATTFGVEIGVRTLFEAPTLALFAERVDDCRLAGQAPVAPGPLAPVARRPTPLPLSYAQSRLWFLDQLAGTNALYHIPYPLQLRGLLDQGALAKALNALVARHESLRTTFPASHGIPAQVIAPTLALPLTVVTLETTAGAATADPEQWWQAHLQSTLWEPFDLATGPLLRAVLYRFTATDHRLVLTFHHTIADGWSLGIFLQELAAFYRAQVSGSTVSLAPLALQYADYTLWQRAWLSGAVLARQVAYWRQQLHHAPTLLTLPTDFPRPAIQRYRGGVVQSTVDETLTAALHTLSRQQGVTLFMTLYGALALLLARYSGQTDLVIGTPIANRQRRECEELIGFFANTLPLRIDLSDNPTGLALLQRACRLTLDAYTHQDLPFEQLVSELQLARTLSHAPLFQVMLALRPPQRALPTFPGLTVSELALESVAAKFDLTLQLQESDGRLHAAWEYDADLFTPATIAHMAEHFGVLLAALVADPTMPVQQLPLLTATERHQLLVTWNQTQSPYPSEQTIHQLFAAQAAQQPAAVAVVFAGEEQEDERLEQRHERRETSAAPASEDGSIYTSHLAMRHSLTYRQLNEQANQLAHYLRRQGVGAGTLVGLCLERSAAWAVGILGIFKAGGAYVPLDPTYPPDRLALISAAAGLGALVTQQALLARFPSLSAPAICVDRDGELIGQLPRTNPAPVACPSDLAYVIYTSGSTGRPKGVMVTHQNLVHSTTARFHAYPQPVGRFLLLSSFAFDSSVAGIFWSLCQGGTLVLPQPDDEKDLARLATLIHTERITHLLALPSLYSLLLRYSNPTQLASLQVAIVAGEPCPPTLPAQQAALLPAVTLYNEYGPTEGTVWSTLYRVPPAWQGTIVPIGRPIPNMQLYLLDPHQQPVPIGVAGELYIGGAGVTPGYLHRPDLTAEKFIVNPFDPTGAAPILYRTGDLARYLPDGNVEFLGRVDEQVKLRGFRIELNEIATVLLQHPQVQAAAVVLHTDAQGQQHLVAYVTAKEETREETRDRRPQIGDTRHGTTALTGALREWVGSRLPAYMVPAAFVGLATMPLTPNGKLDRRALPEPEVRANRAGDYVAPQTAVERKLALIWQELLGVAQVGVADDFFALGGHSLLLAQLAAQIRLTFGAMVGLRTLFQSSTLAAMSAAIAAAPLAQNPLVPAPALRPRPLSPYLHYTAERLDLAVKEGTLPPVIAAALGYWPDEVLHQAGLTATALAAAPLGGQPVVASILATAWGRIAIILLPRLHSQLYVDPTLPLAIGDALHLAGELGAQSVALTGLLPSATAYGHAVQPLVAARSELPLVTTGHAMTAAAVVLNTLGLVAAAGRVLVQERLACLGLGSIGLSTLRLLLQVAPHPATILLCDLAAKAAHLDAIAEELVTVYGFQGEVQIALVEQAVPLALYTASLIVGATNVPDVLAVERLLPGTLLVDDSGPHCFDGQQAIARLEGQQDLLFTEGGAVQLPTPIQQTVYTPPGLEALFTERVLDQPQTLMGCVLSSLLSSRWGQLPPTIGPVAPDQALAYYQTIQQLGVQAAPLHLDGYALPPALITQFRQRFGPGQHKPTVN